MSENMVYEVSEYLTRLNDSLAEHRKHVTKNPPREVQLLRAMKAFMPEENQINADKAIDMMLLVSTCERIRQSQAPPDPSIRPDGVYDIDAGCMTNRNTMNGAVLLALAAMSKG